MKNVNEYFLKYDDHIILDYIDSWPKDLMDFLDENRDVFENYIRTENEIDKKVEVDVNFRICRPNNQYQDQWDKSIGELKEILTLCKFIGFHCTRLVDDEVQDILSDGLSPLSGKLIQKKLNILLENDFIDRETLEKHSEDHLADEENRSGRVCTFHTLNTLKNDIEGLKPVFSYWGGEAFSRGKENSLDPKSEFINIGFATIVVTSHDYQGLKPPHYEEDTIEKRIIEWYLGRDDGEMLHFESSFSEVVKVLECITEKDELFSRLTRYNGCK